MRFVEATLPIFARHETFHPRYSWFRKAYSSTEKDPQIFSRADATVLLGVGKNMVRSIRFWGLAAKIIAENKQLKHTARGCIPTCTGNALFGERGSDIYMEDPGTLWLLHWMLLAPRSKLPVWWIAFNEFNAIEFSEGELEDAVEAQLNATPEFRTPSRSSIKKDVSTFIRTYSTSRLRYSSIDDVFNCPLRELNLISYSDVGKKYRFNAEVKPTLPSEILAFAILNFFARTDAGARTVLINRLEHEPGAPGKIFKLRERDIVSILEPVVTTTDSLNMTSVAGAIQLTWSGHPVNIANDILTNYYYSTDADRLIYDCEEMIKVTMT